MNDHGLPDDERAIGGGGLKAWHLVLIAVVALATVFVYQFFAGREPEPEPPGAVTVVPEGSRTVTLFFAAADETELVGETRQVAIGKAFEEQVRQVVRALIAGPDGAGASTVPEGTRLLGVFYDPDASTLYLDFSGEIIAGHPGGSTAEYFTVSAIMRTISENFPEVQAVQVLVEGSQVGSIAGHISASDPFRMNDWR